MTKIAEDRLHLSLSTSCTLIAVLCLSVMAINIIKPKLEYPPSDPPPGSLKGRKIKKKRERKEERKKEREKERRGQKREKIER